MELQLSVIIWTVINFCILMVILKFLLFKPIMELIEKRHEKVENADNERKNAENALKERSETQRINNEKILETARAKAAADIFAAEEHAVAESLTLRGEFESNTVKNENKFTEDSAEILKQLCENLDSITEAYVKKVVGEKKTICRDNGRITHGNK